MDGRYDVVSSIERTEEAKRRLAQASSAARAGLNQFVDAMEADTKLISAENTQLRNRVQELEALLAIRDRKITELSAENNQLLIEQGKTKQISSGA